MMWLATGAELAAQATSSSKSSTVVGDRERAKVELQQRATCPHNPSDRQVRPWWASFAQTSTPHETLGATRQPK